MRLGGVISALTGVSVLVAVLLDISPNGKAKKAVRLVCGIAILSVLFGSVKELDLSDYSYEIRKQEMISEKMVSELDEVNDALNRSIIEEKCETYILDKAELNNIEIKGVSVLADWSTDGFWYPCSAEIILTQGNQEKDTLAYYINSELGITEENICWRYENDTT